MHPSANENFPGLAIIAICSGLNTLSETILFRILPDLPSFITQTPVTVLESRTYWAGHFSIVKEDRVRMTRL